MRGFHIGAGVLEQAVFIRPESAAGVPEGFRLTSPPSARSQSGPVAKAKIWSATTAMVGYRRRCWAPRFRQSCADKRGEPEGLAPPAVIAPRSSISIRRWPPVRFFALVRNKHSRS